MHLTLSDFEHFARLFLIEPGSKVNVQQDFNPRDTYGYERPDNAAEILQDGIELLAEYQERLYAENSQALLVVLQALDAAGKDSTIKHVMSGVNPAGCQVASFKAPTVTELDQDYLWRCVKALPARGNIGIFNRSHYEEVLVVRVHPRFLDAQRLPTRVVDDEIWSRRLRQINNWEQHLVENGTEIVKIFLNVSWEKQAERQLERIDKPDKHWKFNPNDIEERRHWDAYMAAYNEVFEHTSTACAPWYVVPADRKWFARIAVAAIIAQKLIEMDPQFPTVSEAQRQEMLACREVLLAEQDAPSSR